MIATEYDVGSPARHVCSYGHCAKTPGLGHNLSLLLMVFRIQHGMLNAFFLQHAAKKFRFLYRGRSHERRLAFLVALLDLRNYSIEFDILGLVNNIREVRPNQRPVSRYHQNFEIIYLCKFGGLSVGSTGHARELIIHPEKILECYSGESLVFTGYLNTLFCLNSLVKPVTPPSARHNPSRKFIDYDHLTVFYDILHVSLVEVVGPQRLKDVMNQLYIIRFIKITDAEKSLNLR